jgi:hypothetical protein
MKLYRALGLAAVIALSQLALAAPPVPPKALGQVDATVSFCSRVDSKNAEKYKEFGKALTRDMSEKELTEARSSNDYKETYDAITAELEKIPVEKAVEACRASSNDSNKTNK